MDWRDSVEGFGLMKTATALCLLFARVYMRVCLFRAFASAARAECVTVLSRRVRNSAFTQGA